MLMPVEQMAWSESNPESHILQKSESPIFPAKLHKYINLQKKTPKLKKNLKQIGQ